MVFELTVILALIAANGVLAGAEIAIISVRKSRLEQLSTQQRAGARAALKLREAPESFLATVQVGITVVGAAAAAFGGAAVAARLARLLELLGWSPRTAADVSLAAVVAALSFLSVVFGELVPKSLALRFNVGYATFIARPLQALSWIARPLVRLLTATSNLVLKPFGDATSFTETRFSADELQHLVDEAARTGELDTGASSIASRAIDFARLTAADVMVPRNQIVAIPKDATQDRIRQLLLEEGHTRMPVYEGNLDNVVGYITTTDVLSLVWERNLIVLDDIIRPPLFLPEAAPAARVLRELQGRRTRMAVVVDEHGGVSGLVTLEDLLEELVGDLFSEDEVPRTLVRLQPDGSALVRGDAPVREVNRELQLHLPEGDGWSTLAGLCMALTGSIPEPGARMSAGGALIEVVEATPRLVRMVRIVPQRADDRAPAEP